MVKQGVEKLKIRFRELVDAKGIPKTRCAKEIGISYKMFSNIYNYGKGRKLVALILISQYFHVSIDYLLGLSDDKNVKKPNSQNNDIFERESDEQRGANGKSENM